MSVLNDFKKFALRGNIVDMAIGFTVGAAFSTIAKSLVDDLLMPPVGLVLGRTDFSDLFWVLKPGPDQAPPYTTVAEAEAAGAVTLDYGQFVNNVVAFLIVALAMFVIVRLIHKMEDGLEATFGDDKAQPTEPTHKKCLFCRTTIAYRAVRCPNCTSDLTDADDSPVLSRKIEAKAT